MQLDLFDETNTITKEHLNLVERLLQFSADQEKISAQAEMSVTFVDNAKIQEVNKDYRGKDYATDVISFAMQDEGEGEMAIVGDNLPLILGDIIISVDKISEQAQDYEHSFERELGFLAVHGFLHLLGYDHMEPDDEKEMFGKQEEYLNEFGLKRK
ncbi:probable rRNA maturation factor [Salinibacillus kushneri]|uniref:Endoribonuclease YbeY n=1 Tax=Salinibacillus kushneri TaxID=237682 RepID=A0A1I0FZN5_9BACI|nr:rRNA maturation RNase YbeY [Salinibacillus kushneri]SET63789.1 probable rRNA maturation factor [Salinibacillus kushneri]